MRDVGIYPKKGQPYPPSPSEATIQAWLDGEDEGPNLAAPCLDWSSFLSTPWNEETIHLLAKEFLRRIKAGEQPPLPTTYDLTLSRAVELCKRKLEERQRQFIKKELMEDEELEKEAAADSAQRKRNSRRNTVILTFLSLFMN